MERISSLDDFVRAWQLERVRGWTFIPNILGALGVWSISASDPELAALLVPAGIIWLRDALTYCFDIPLKRIERQHWLFHVYYRKRTGA